MRHLVGEPEARTGHGGGMSMREWAKFDEAPKSRPRRRRPPRKSPVQARQAAEEAAAMLEANGSADWGGLTPRLVVGMYLALHEMVYGVEAEDVAEVWAGACSSAAKLMRDPPFDGEPLRVVDFMRWVWRRERDRESKAAGERAFRITWRFMFTSRVLIVDWMRARAACGRARRSA